MNDQLSVKEENENDCQHNSINLENEESNQQTQNKFNNTGTYQGPNGNMNQYGLNLPHHASKLASVNKY